MIKLKKCTWCKAQFPPARPLQKVCSLACAQTVAAKKREKIERATDKQKREALKGRSAWQKEAQAAFNAFIRARDADLPCISCGRHHNGQYHAGHYLSTGARPELRFDERNVHKQCQPCNTHLSGNLVLYRVALIKKIGLSAVEELEGFHETHPFSIDDLKAIKAIYKQKLKHIQTAVA